MCLCGRYASGFYNLVDQSILFTNKTKASKYIHLLYSGTPPFDHPVYKTTSLLRQYSFKPNVTTIESFYYFEDPVNATTSLLRPGFYGPTVVALTGFHCSLVQFRCVSDCSPCAFLALQGFKRTWQVKKLALTTYFLSKGELRRVINSVYSYYCLYYCLLTPPPPPLLLRSWIDGLND